MCRTTIYQNKPVRFTEKYFDSITTLPAKHVDGVAVWFFFQLIHHNGTEAIDGLSHVRVSGHDINVGCKGNITKHGSSLQSDGVYSVSAVRQHH